MLYYQGGATNQNKSLLRMNVWETGDNYSLYLMGNFVAVTNSQL